MALVRACRALSVPTLARRALTVAPRRQLTSVSAETPIGVVGVGNVGDAVCKNLLRSGYKVAAMYDIDPRRGADLDDRIPRATCSRQVAEQSDVVITCLPKPAHVEASYSGADGLLAGLQHGRRLDRPLDHRLSADHPGTTSR
ncbi:3-hydroxyisobutyrate dehydrogenase, mitochondrial-like [Pollicipes pollicipes]|uniref:3-hydroxyisobutyrate dehydrogenase, mitochondrial-like n=1 Tax=Pollicipes pollicipes TaxID=41117 RepID=UPI001884D870|nr:3-hydroxyisobutyrate dehydrogenase, mitochondrial-like [Pollicipes pollicipes]